MMNTTDDPAQFAVGDWVKLNPDSEYEYEVAEIRRFPHGFMVGIYDEPPSKVSVVHEGLPAAGCLLVENPPCFSGRLQGRSDRLVSH